MKQRNLLVCILLLGILFSCKPSDKSVEFKAFDLVYPEVKMDTSVKDVYHDTLIADPFRWLEDDNSQETKEWVNSQNELTYKYLERIPYRDQLHERLKKLWNFERYSVPQKAGEYYYFFKNDGLQNQDVLYRIKSLDDAPELVLDPNGFSEDGTVAMGYYGFHKNGKYLGYQVAERGSDWMSIYVLDLESLKLTNDKVNWVKFSSVNWAGDGFYYSRYPEPKKGDVLSASNRFHQLYYHKLGTHQTQDQLVYDDPDHPERNIYASVSSDGQNLFLYPIAGTSGNALKWKNIKEGSAVQNLVGNFNNDFTVIDALGGHFLVMTNYEAPNFRIIKIDPQNPEESNWKDIIPESKDVLREASIFGNRIFANYLQNAKSVIKGFELDGKYLGDIDLPGLGTVEELSGDVSSSLAFYSFKSFISPESIYSFDTKTLNSSAFKIPEVEFNSDEYITKQEWYTSYDGTPIPMFITHKKDFKKSGKSPTLLYGYGGFNIPYLPDYDVRRLPILENDGIYVVANIRGGGEFGSEWHKAGTLSQKQNVFDDFQAAAEYLIRENYTSKEKLAIEGRSNGGLLVGACITQRPDLYQVAFPIVGVLDMLRYHQFTIGWAWASDYGRSDDPEAFDYLIKYSPLHNIKAAAYPATLVTTADHDDRVVPAHSFKFTSELQRKHTGENPVLIRVDKSSGHKDGKPVSKRIDEAADMLSFMFYNLKASVAFELKN